MGLRVTMLLYLILFGSFLPAYLSSRTISFSDDLHTRVKHSCPPGLTSKRLAKEGLKLLLELCEAPDDSRKKALLKAYKLILDHEYLFGDPFPSMKTITGNDTAGITFSSALVAWEQLNTLLSDKLDSSSDLARWKRIAPILEYLASNDPKSFLVLLTSTLEKDYEEQAKKLALFLEESIISKKFFSDALVVSAYRTRPGYESLMLLNLEGLTINISRETGHQHLIDKVISAAKSMAAHKETSSSREVLVENIMEAIRVSSRDAPLYIGLPAILLDYNMDELKRITTNWHEPHLKSLLLMGRKVFDVPKLLSKQINAQVVLSGLRALLAPKSFASKLPRLLAFLSKKDTTKADFEKLSAVLFNHCSRHRFSPAEYRDWEALQWTLASEGLITLTLSDHLLSVLAWFSDGDLAHKPLVEAYKLELSGWGIVVDDEAELTKRLLSLFGSWRQIRDSEDAGFMLQPHVYNPFSLIPLAQIGRSIEIYRTLLVSLKVLVQEGSKDLLAVLSTLEKATVKDLRFLFHQLYNIMKRPISAKDTPSFVEKELLQTSLVMDIQLDSIRQDHPGALEVLADFVPPPNIASIDKLKEAIRKFIEGRSAA